MPRRILFVDHTPFAGGAQLVLVEHIRALDKKQFEPHVACTDTVPELVTRFEEAGAQVHVIAMPRMRGYSISLAWQLPRSIWQLRRLMLRQHIALVVANSTRASYVASLAQLGTGVPVIWWVRDFLYPKALFRFLKRLPVRIAFVSKAIRNYYVAPDDSKAVVLYVASRIYEQLDHIETDQIMAEKLKYDIAKDDVVVGFMGRLVEEKGAEDVVRAVGALLPEFPSLKLLIAGTGKNQMHDVEDHLHSLVTEQGWSKNIMFAGYQNDEALYYSMFDIFVLATRDSEPFATSVVQAMMAGNTVIGTRAGGTPELVLDHETGLLYEPGNVDELVGTIRQLLDDRALTRKLAERGKRRVLHYHREEQLARQAEALYREVLER